MCGSCCGQPCECLCMCVWGGGGGGKRMVGEGTCTSVLCFTLNLWPLAIPAKSQMSEAVTSSEKDAILSQKVYGKCGCHMITS